MPAVEYHVPVGHAVEPCESVFGDYDGEPSSFICSIMARMSAMAFASRLLVGSSNTTTLGPSMVAAATAMRCFWPPDR